MIALRYIFIADLDMRGGYLWFSHTLGFAGFKFCVIGKEMEGMLVDGAWHGVERIDGSLGGWPLVRCCFGGDFFKLHVDEYTFFGPIKRLSQIYSRHRQQRRDV